MNGDVIPVRMYGHEYYNWIETFEKEKVIYCATDQIYNPIFVEDAAKVIVNLIKKKTKGIFYLGGETITFEQMFNDIYNLWFPNFKIMKKQSKKKIHHQINIASKQFHNCTSFYESLKKINKDKLKNVQ